MPLNPQRNPRNETATAVNASLKPSPADSPHDRLYKQALKLLQPQLPLRGQRMKKPGFFAARSLRKGIMMLMRVVTMNPENWPAMSIAAMACRRLGDLPTAMLLYERAVTVAGDNPEIARDAGFTAMEMGKAPMAVEYLGRAVTLQPENASSIANLALAHLFNQNPIEAKRAADYAVHIQPTDPVIQRIAELIENVITGKQKCPHNAAEIISQKPEMHP